MLSILKFRYGLRPEDYNTMNPDDPIKYAGDYPDLGIVTYDHKDPYEAWTDRQNRRNWGEMVRFYFLGQTVRKSFELTDFPVFLIVQLNITENNV